MVNCKYCVLLYFHIYPSLSYILKQAIHWGDSFGIGGIIPIPGIIIIGCGWVIFTTSVNIINMFVCSLYTYCQVVASSTVFMFCKVELHHLLCQSSKITNLMQPTFCYKFANITVLNLNDDFFSASIWKSVKSTFGEQEDVKQVTIVQINNNSIIISRVCLISHIVL